MTYIRSLVVALLLSVPTVASAEAVLFTDRAAFDAAVGAHQLFTDFDLRHVPGTYDAAGTFGGVTTGREVFEINWCCEVQQTLSVNGVHSEGRGNGLYFSTTDPIRAFGFDVVSAFAYDAPLTPPFPYQERPQPQQYVPEVFLSYRTANGPPDWQGQPAPIRVPVGGFIGALIYDDAFAAFSINTAYPTCMCISGLAIDNLAVAAVPEPAAVWLLGLGLVGMLVASRVVGRAESSYETEIDPAGWTAK